MNTRSKAALSQQQEDTPLSIPYLFAGMSLLMSVAYLDNARGPLLPIISRVLSLPHTYTGMFLTAGNLAAMFSTLLMVVALRRYSEKKVTLCICYGALAITLTAPFVHALWSLLVLGIVTGIVIAMGGAMCNVLTIKGAPDKLRGRALSAQQVMYGVGSFLAPLIVAFTVTSQWPWWTSLAIGSIFLFILAVSYTIILPYDHKDGLNRKQAPPLRLGLVHFVALLCFGLYVAGEVMTSMWMSSYLVEFSKLSASHSAPYVSGFFAMMATTRILSFLFVRPRFERVVLYASLILGSSALIIALSGVPYAFPFVGIVGPFFPLFMAELSRSFRDIWQSIVVLVSVSMQISLSLMNLTVGGLSDRLGIHNAFYLAPLLLICALGSLLFYEKLNSASRS